MQKLIYLHQMFAMVVAHPIETLIVSLVDENVIGKVYVSES